MSSGGGIRTRDLRVMSPTSYQTAPPRVAELHNSNSAAGPINGPARASGENPARWPTSSSPARCPATRSSGCAAAHDVDVWPGDAAAAARGAARAGVAQAEGLLSPARPTRSTRELLDAAPQPARDRQLRRRLRQHRPRGDARRAAIPSASRRTCSPTPPPTSRSRCMLARRPPARRGRGRRPRRARGARGSRRAGSAPTSTARRSRSSGRAHRPGGRAARARASTWTVAHASTAATTCDDAARRAPTSSRSTRPLTAEHPPPHRRRRAGAHEADGDPRQHRPRRPIVDQDALRRGAARAARSPAPRSTSPTPSRCRPTTRCYEAPNLLVVPHIGSATTTARAAHGRPAPSTTCSPALAGQPMPHPVPHPRSARACASPSSTSARTRRACSSPTSQTTAG